MQHNTPDKDTPEQRHPDPHLGGEAASIGDPFTSTEWKILTEIPVQISRAVIAASPSGAIGTAKEVIAMRNCMQETLKGATNPLLKTLYQQLQGKETIEDLWNQAGQAFSDRWDATNVRQTALKACQQAAVLLKKVSPQEAESYKEFVYLTAQKVAEAAPEGGFMGMGGERVSEPERVLLKDVASALGLQRA